MMIEHIDIYLNITTSDDA